METYEEAIRAAYTRCTTPKEIISVEKIIIKEIEKRIRTGRSDCIECDIQALTYHNTILLTFKMLDGRAEEFNENLRELLRNL